MTQDIEKLIIRYLVNSATESDLRKLSKWLENPLNKEIFEDFIRTHFAINYNMNKPDSKLIANQLLREIRDEKSFTSRVRTKYTRMYVAAASLLLAFFVTMMFLNRADDTTPISVESQAQDMEINSITPGTDKATLTLEDGSILNLEKGSDYKTQHVSSHGDKLIYNKKSRPQKEISYNLLTIPRGGEYQVILSDGTRVWLNSESQLKYPVNFIEGQLREVELLYGEAYFDVSSSTLNDGAGFVVVNQSQRVEVLGTEFNVKAYKDEVSTYTTLVEGEVAINYNQEKQFLKPNQQFRLDLKNSKTSITEVDVSSVVAWKNGVFSFKNTPFKEIVKVISRWYDVDFVFENKAYEELTFKGVLGKNQNLEEILSTIKTLSIIKNYKINGKTITLN